MEIKEKPRKEMKMNKNDFNKKMILNIKDS
jgi:hypothetical protein